MGIALKNGPGTLSTHKEVFFFFSYDIQINAMTPPQYIQFMLKHPFQGFEFMKVVREVHMGEDRWYKLMPRLTKTGTLNLTVRSGLPRKSAHYIMALVFRTTLNHLNAIALFLHWHMFDGIILLGGRLFKWPPGSIIRLISKSTSGHSTSNRQQLQWTRSKSYSRKLSPGHLSYLGQ